MLTPSARLVVGAVRRCRPNAPGRCARFHSSIYTAELRTTRRIAPVHLVMKARGGAGCAANDEDRWPDGTPKRFKGRDAWKNWIDWNSPHRQETDELNRARHYFWHVDDRGRLWRKELDRPDEHFGQMRDARTLDFFFGHVQRNYTGLYADAFPFISFRMHEHYFTSCADSPIVFNDLRDGELRHICPDGELARSITTRFEPERLRITAEGKLLHPVVTKAVDEVGAQVRQEELLALIESTTAQQLLECCEERAITDQGSGLAAPDAATATFVLVWEGSATLLLPWSGTSNGVSDC